MKEKENSPYNLLIENGEDTKDMEDYARMSTNTLVNFELT